MYLLYSEKTITQLGAIQYNKQTSKQTSKQTKNQYQEQYQE